jgi:hypothetical protein
MLISECLLGSNLSVHATPEKLNRHLNLSPKGKLDTIQSELMTLSLTFKCSGRYLNFTTWFMKNVLFEQEKIKLLNKQHFVENKTEIKLHIFKMR